ncbi:hypothetical protein [Saccharopolyspora shandongensis]|uniref:hypothetical protein n=1 Tax=Saccharopolyspora shandongensis TaxID=418495 RepID=UPI0033F325C5
MLGDRRRIIALDPQTLLLLRQILALLLSHGGGELLPHPLLLLGPRFATGHAGPEVGGRAADLSDTVGEPVPHAVPPRQVPYFGNFGSTTRAISIAFAQVASSLWILSASYLIATDTEPHQMP